MRAREKDAGFELDVFVEMTRQFERLPRSDFPLDDEGYRQLAHKVSACADIARQIERDNRREIRRDHSRGEGMGLDL